MTKLAKFTDEQITGAKRNAAYTPAPDAVTDPDLDALVNELIGRVADKWTMLILEVLAEGGELRFTRISERVEGISQKMLTQTLRQMERDGLLTRTIYPVVPPQGRVQADRAWSDARWRVLWRVGVGGGESEASRAGPPRL